MVTEGIDIHYQGEKTPVSGDDSLSVIIPGRNEEFFGHTVEHVLSRIRANTEVIAVVDGDWPEPPINYHPRLRIVRFADPIGQRAATNQGALLSKAKYIMKLDAHCAVAKGFDNCLIEACEPDWTLIPAMYNLHAFDWVCTCGERVYQGATPPKCKCGKREWKKEIIWQPRKHRKTVSWRFDSDLQFRYWRKHKNREECKGRFIETMSCVGCTFFMERERFFEHGGMDENHGSWGQFGTELACKAWLSGGKMVTDTRTWIAHMFRTNNFREDGKSAFPFPISQKQINHARKYSKDYWTNGKWDKAIHDVQWLVDKFKPVPGW